LPSAIRTPPRPGSSLVIGCVGFQSVTFGRSSVPVTVTGESFGAVPNSRYDPGPTSSGLSPSNTTASYSAESPGLNSALFAANSFTNGSAFSAFSRKGLRPGAASRTLSDLRPATTAWATLSVGRSSSTSARAVSKPDRPARSLNRASPRSRAAIVNSPAFRARSSDPSSSTVRGHCTALSPKLSTATNRSHRLGSRRLRRMSKPVTATLRPALPNWTKDAWVFEGSCTSGIASKAPSLNT